MRNVCLLVGLLVLAAVSMHAADRVQAPAERALSAFGDDPSRQFDFWIGQWSVNLRMQQEDLSFADSVAARAHVYSILGGKAILELWDSEPIKGYSLRYFDPAKGKWVLWLDWPSKNRSSISSLEGEFRHGRGDFYSRYKNAKGESVVERFSFNDITPFSLRWDDLYSSDGGKTWGKNWVMEFRRIAMDPVWPVDPSDVPTFVDGGRCDAREFRPYEAIVGGWSGDGVGLEAFRILDGCAVMAFLEAGERREFLFMTFVSGQRRWETQVLDRIPESGLKRYHSEEGWTRLTADDGESLVWTPEADTLVYERGQERVVLTRTR